jgi:ferredoxin
MKTHQLTRITGAVKNLFGCIPGRRKALYHVQFQDVMDFSRLLVELNLRLRPRLHVMDGVLAMEGNGPRSGDPQRMNVLIMSDDPVAVDATFCRLVAMEPEFVPTSTIGGEQGLGRFQDSEIEYLGDPLESFRQPDFKVIRKPVYRNASYAYYNVIKNAVLPRPVIDADSCVKCGRCVEACPVPGKALRFENGRQERPPVYHYDLCIRCYCCHEMCPQRAIEKKTPLLGRILQLG